MKSEPPKSDPPRGKRRWYQFSLRTLLIVTTVCAIGSAWVAQRMERKRVERGTIDKFLKLGGRVGYVSGLDEAAGPGWLRQFLGENYFDDVDYVDLGRTAVTDDDLENLSVFPQLMALQLVGTHISDAGLKNLKNLGHLRLANFTGSKVTDAGVKDLQSALPDCIISDARGQQHTKTAP